MKALLVVAHGSRRSQSNTEIQALTQRIAEEAGEDFDLVECAFLELADPLIPAGLKSLAGKGAKSIRVLPYFLAAGTHVASDIPSEVDKGKAELADVDIEILPYLGTHPELPSILLSLARSVNNPG